MRERRSQIAEALADAAAEVDLGEVALAHVAAGVARLDARLLEIRALLGRPAAAAAPAGTVDISAPTAGRLLGAEEAAARLGVSLQALRHRCRRAQRKEGREVVARLGGGVVAHKFGASWRFRFQQEDDHGRR